MLLGAKVNNAEILDRRAAVTIMASHSLALKNFSRICTVTNRSTMPKIFMGPMAGRGTAHTVTFHNASVTPSLCPASNNNPFSKVKNLLGGYLMSDFVLINVSSPKLTQHFKRAGPRGLAVAQNGLTHPLRFAAAKAELKRGVTIFLAGFLLDDRTGSRLDDSHWD